MPTSKRHGMWLVALVSVLALVAGACGSDSNNNASSGSGPSTTTKEKPICAPGTIKGAGSTFVKNILEQWTSDYQAACPGSTISYQAGGSGAGVALFLAGTDVQFAASDAVLKPEEEQQAVAKGGPVVHIPWTSGGIAVEYHLTGVKDLKLSPAVLAGIFAGKITTWDSAKLKADNPTATLPPTPIQVVYRHDGSGTTKVFTSYLAAVAPSLWTFGSDKDYKGPVGQGVDKSDGVTGLVKQTEGSITYAEVSYAKGAGLPIALIQNKAGKFVSPTPDAVSAALASAEVPTDLKVKVNYNPDDPAAYPISTTTWFITFQHPKDPAIAKLLQAYVLYATSAGQAAAPGLDYAPLPATLLAKDKAAAQSIAAS